MTALVLAPTRRHFGFGDKNDHVMLQAGRVIGRIFLASHSPSDRPWFWTLTAQELATPTNSRGYSATREEAIADCTSTWLSESKALAI